MNEGSQQMFRDVSELNKIATDIQENLEKVIIGKSAVIRHVLVGLFAGGNILLEDVPGVGKTTLAKALAKSLEIKYSRIQFTPDLLPADILGGSIFNPQTGEFSFREGPIFANILLADEINRASPRTQSALLEAMTEHQATVEGQPRPIPQPFLVIATQNPVEFHGTYPLPEAQLDRFLIRLEIGYPDREQESDILFAQKGLHPIELLSSAADKAALFEIQKHVMGVGVEKTVADYIVRLIQATRADNRLRLGASPRASLMLFRAAQALAFLNERNYVIPDDVKELADPILSHRLVMDAKAKYAGSGKNQIIHDIVQQIEVPI